MKLPKGLKIIGIIEAITPPTDGSVYERRLADTPIPQLSDRLWRELRYLGRIEQRILQLKREVEAAINREA